MFYRLAADGVLVFHLAFIVFALLGGLLALRWRWVPWLQVPALVWAFFIEMSGRICPLTPLENTLRQHAGQSGFAGGFVDQYLIPLIYPEGLTRDIQWQLAGVVVAVNLAVYGWLLVHRRGAPA
ncbi:MAG: DUF2784 domain-containing protein [Polaromonas sp.]|nr:DUF2784 domain-containing protein [Polaromonas sp.]